MQGRIEGVIIMKANYNKFNTEDLIDEVVNLDKLLKVIKTNAEAMKAILQARGIELLEDKNIKTTEWYGTGSNNVVVTKAQTMEILNFPELEKVFNIRLLEDKIVRKLEVKYDIDPIFKQALISIFSDDYTSDMSLNELLTKQFPELETKQISLLLKRLKGDYKKDKAVLKSLVTREDLDEELYYINKIKNYEKIRAYFGDNVDEMISAIKKNILVDETIKITIKYDTEKENL